MAFPIRPHKLFLSGERSGCELLPQTPFFPLVSFGSHAALGVSAICEVKADHSTLFQCYHSFSLQLLSCSDKDRVMSSQSLRTIRAPLSLSLCVVLSDEGQSSSCGSSCSRMSKTIALTHSINSLYKTFQLL